VPDWIQDLGDLAMSLRDQMAEDLNVFLNPDEFAEWHTVDGTQILCLFTKERRDRQSLQGTYSVDVLTIEAKTADLMTLHQGLPKVNNTIVVDKITYDVTSAIDTAGMFAIECEAAA
jgi:hypothetical protein